MKRVINPGLMAALLHFGEHRFPSEEPVQVTLFQHRRPNGESSAWTVEKTCLMAHELLALEPLAQLKLQHLQERMREMGMADLYQHLMGEPLP